MGKNHIIKLIIYSLLFCAILYMVNPGRVNAATLDSAQESNLQLLDGDFHQDASPSPTPEISLTETAGRGEGLIFIASIIVLIILTGVIFSSRRRK